MSNSKKRQAKKKQQQKAKVDWRSRLKDNWKAKSPILRFLLGFLVCLILFYSFYYSSWYETNLRDSILGFQAAVGGKFIQLLGYDVSVDSGMIVGKDFAMSIKNGCDGLEATVLFLVAVLMFPLRFSLKMPGLLLGFLALSFANLIRIVGLYMIGIHWKSAFEFFHLHGGLVLFMVFAISIWMIWISWAFKKEKMYVSS